MRRSRTGRPCRLAAGPLSLDRCDSSGQHVRSMVRRCLLAAIVVAVAASAVRPRSAGPWSCARAVYLAGWAHEFFGILDGPVSSFAVASTPLASDGSFALTLPDLLHDPI